jgi:hypothetical protein
MQFWDIINIVIASILLLFTIRDILLSNINHDFSDSNWFFKWFLSPKQHIAAKQLAKEMGFESLKELKKKVRMFDSDPCKKIIQVLSKCIYKNNKYQFGSNDKEQKHSSCYYIDTIGFAHKEKNCKDLFELLKILIGKHEYNYVFTSKNMNMSLISMFAFEEGKIPIIAKEEGDLCRVTQEVNEDYFINYEGLRELKDRFSDTEGASVKGIAITCNLADGKAFSDAIYKFNNTLQKLKEDDDINKNIKKIEKVFILYRVIDDEEFDTDYTNVNLECIRYFDLNEGSKQYLFNKKEHDKEHDADDYSNFSCYNCMKEKIDKLPECGKKHCFRDRKKF